MLQLVINADDFGYDPAINRGIVHAMREGIVTSTTLMVNTPFAEHAASMANGLAVGLHLNLARNRPVSNGFPASLLTNGELDEAKASGLPAEVVERETAAQLERLKALLGRPATHVDVHRHLHRHPNVLEGVLAVAASAGLPVRSIDEAMRQRLRERGVATNDAFVGDAGAGPYWTLERLRDVLGSLPSSGVVELMCHVGYQPESVRTSYGPQREVELQTFLHTGARQRVERLGAALVDWTAVR